MHGAIEDVFCAQAENEVSARRGGLEILRVQTEFAGERKIKNQLAGIVPPKSLEKHWRKKQKIPEPLRAREFFSFLFSDFCGYFAMTFSTGSPSMNNPPIAVNPCFCRKITYIGLPLLFAFFRIADTFSLSNLPVE